MSTLARNIIVLAIIVLVGAGAYWAGRQQGEINALSVRTGGDALPPDMGRLQEENTRLQAENERLMAQRPTTEASVAMPAPAEAAPSAAMNEGHIERLRTIAELQQKKLASISVPVVSRDGKLQNGFAELFDLTPAEKDTLQQAVNQALKQTEQVTVANATMTRRPDGAIVISVPPSADGAAVRDGLMNTLAQTLGPERNEAFLALNSTTGPNQFANAFNGFGADDRTITISHISGPNGASRISLNDAHRSTTPGGGGNISMGTSVNDLSQLPENLRWLGPLIPADF